MSQPSVEPEFILAESARTVLTAKQLDNLGQMLRDLEVDTRVLYKELTKLEGFCGRIADDIRVLALLVWERE